ncbi:MAG: pyridoxal phosphate-dependent aminotransferase [Anaeroplasmataceae bacterium]
MRLLSDHSLKKENKGNALLIGKIAREKKLNNPNVIDATLGMLYDDKNQLFVFNTVEKIIKTLSKSEMYPYGIASGDKDFHEAVKKWVFKETLTEVESKSNISVIATPGGTGALSNTFSNYLNLNDVVLFPNYMWSNYKQIATEEHLNFDTYNLFDDYNRFNIVDLEKKCQLLKSKQERILIVVNDPCQNPTGYTMKYDEWVSLISLVNSLSKDGTPVILVYDMAYIDYDKRGLAASRKNLKLFSTLNDSALCVIAFSASKTLGLYGFRVGAQIAISKNEQVITDFINANEYSSRAKWSATSLIGMNIVKHVFLNNLSDFEKELSVASKLIVERAELLIDEASRNKVETLPYDCGFFVTIPAVNPQKLVDYLVDNDIYVLALENAIRVAVSSINKDEIVRIIKVISSFDLK